VPFAITQPGMTRVAQSVDLLLRTAEAANRDQASGDHPPQRANYSKDQIDTHIHTFKKGALESWVALMANFSNPHYSCNGKHR
jgi:hypothetical protein